MGFVVREPFTLNGVKKSVGDALTSAEQKLVAEDASLHRFLVRISDEVKSEVKAVVADAAAVEKRVSKAFDHPKDPSA